MEVTLKLTKCESVNAKHFYEMCKRQIGKIYSQKIDLDISCKTIHINLSIPIFRKYTNRNIKKRCRLLIFSTGYLCCMSNKFHDVVLLLLHPPRAVPFF